MTTRPPMSSRAMTRETGRFVRDTPGSRTLSRGLDLLRTFRPGTGSLSNAELSERTGLPRPTVSRLTRSLVDDGFLAYDRVSRGYRLGPVCLGLARSFRDQNAKLHARVVPLMRAVAEGEKVNVGLAVADAREMIYIESVRQTRMGIFRRIAEGTRTPMELTALGRAHLAALAPAVRQDVTKRLAEGHPRARWRAISGEIRQAVADIARVGYCHAMWQQGMIAIATSCVDPDGTIYALNISFPWMVGDPSSTIARYGAMLVRLRGEVQAAIDDG